MKKEIKAVIMLLAIAIFIAGVIFVTSPPNTGEEGKTESTPSVSISDGTEMFTVTFFAPDDRLLLSTQVESGEAAVPPQNPTMPQGYIFSHWDADFSCVTEDMSVYAVCEQVDNADNALALSGGYAHQGDLLTLPLQLCGNVCLCAFDIRITYDPDMLEFMEFQTQDGAVDANSMEEGVICLNFASMENTIGEVDLADLVFTVVGESGQTTVDIEVVEMIAYDSEYNFTEPEYTLVPATIVVVGS